MVGKEKEGKRDSLPLFVARITQRQRPLRRRSDAGKRRRRTTTRGRWTKKKMKKENADGKSYVTKLLLFFFLRRRCRTLTRSGIATAAKKRERSRDSFAPS